MAKNTVYFIVKNLISIFCLLVLTINLNAQTNEREINGHNFSFKVKVLDSEFKVLELFRGQKQLLRHILLKREADCSSTTIQLGNYEIHDNSITFYSYWAAADRMPAPLLPYGFFKQTYTVDKSGFLRLREAEIYIEDFADADDKSFLEETPWQQHKGLRFLNQRPKNESEQRLLDDYILRIRKKYNAKFVLGQKRMRLEKEVRLKLKNQIQEHTKDWGDEEVYGKFKK